MGWLMDSAQYNQWRKIKLDNYPRSVKELRVDIDGLNSLSDAQKASITEKCQRYNMAVYRCRDGFVAAAAWPSRLPLPPFWGHRPRVSLCPLSEARNRFAKGRIFCYTFQRCTWIREKEPARSTMTMARRFLFSRRSICTKKKLV